MTARVRDVLSTYTTEWWYPLAMYNGLVASYVRTLIACYCMYTDTVHTYVSFLQGKLHFLRMSSHPQKLQLQNLEGNG